MKKSVDAPTAVETVTTAEPVPTTDDQPEAPEPSQEPEPSEDPGFGLGEPAAAEEESVTFGETAKWDSGVTVTVSEPEEYERGDLASGGENFERFVRLTTVVTNEGDKPLEPLFSK